MGLFLFALSSCLLASVLAGSQPNTTVVAPTFVVNLDLPAEQRWTDIVTLYKASAPLILNYVTAAVPARPRRSHAAATHSCEDP